MMIFPKKIEQKLKVTKEFPVVTAQVLLLRRKLNY